MSAPATAPAASGPGLFRPRFILAGFLAGLVLCALAARFVSSRGYHDNFLRFHVRLSPEAHYYPTMEEMRGIVRARCRPDQILVIVGGNSIFHGVGQPVGKVWTQHLQTLLGDQYAVVNFAFRGAMTFDAGALVAESLRDEYPRQIFITNSAPFTQPHPLGMEAYRYLFWEARSRGLLEDFAPRDAVVAAFEAKESSLAERLERRGAGQLDRLLRYRDLWNWVGYRYLFTIQNPHTPTMPQATWPRSRFKDEEGDYESFPFSQRFLPQNREAEMAITRGFSGTYYELDAQGGWRLKEGVLAEFTRVAKAAVPDDLKGRTLVMLSRNSPYFLNQLTAEESRREEVAYREALAAWTALGYHAAEYGRDFAPTDYGDRTHLTSTGGRKLAEIVAAQVRQIAAGLASGKDRHE